MTDTTLESLRKAWRNTTVSTSVVDNATRTIGPQLHSRRSVGIARRLARDYYRMLWPCLLIIALCAPMYYMLHTPLWLTILYGAFGLVQGAVLFCLARYIDKSDFLTLPVIPAIRRATKIRMFQRRILCLSIPFGLIVVIPLFKFFYESPGGFSALVGGIIGGIVGLIIGIRKEIRFFRTSRHLLRTIQRYAE